MKRVFKKVKNKVTAIYYAIGIEYRTLKRAMKEAWRERNYLSIMSREEQKEWIDRVFDSYEKEELFNFQCRTIRKYLEKLNAA